MRDGAAARYRASRRQALAAARRIGTAPHALTVAGTLLALAALVQVGAEAITLPSVRGGSVAFYAVPLCLLAAADTVPLIFLRPLPATVFITAASVLSLAAFGVVTAGGAPAGGAPAGAATAGLLTAGGAAAQLIAVGGSAQAGPGDCADGSGPGGWRANAQYLALAMAVPFIVLAATSRGGEAAVLLASLVPMAAGTGIAVRSRRSASLEGVVRSELSDTLVEHMARGERARIARELHDVVAHHISMISVQAETARLTVPELTPEGTRRLREIGDTARAGLTEMRRLLGVLRADADSAAVGERQPQPGLRELSSLIDGSRAASGAGTRLILSGPVVSFDPGVELAAYRIVQEALTNARRHAPGAAVDVELCYRPDKLLVRVRDNGPGPGPDGTAKGPGAGAARGRRGAGSGHGLPGMRERAATVGGTLRTGAAPGGGFLVEAELPAQPEEGS